MRKKGFGSNTMMMHLGDHCKTQHWNRRISQCGDVEYGKLEKESSEWSWISTTRSRTYLDSSSIFRRRTGNRSKGDYHQSYRWSHDSGIYIDPLRVQANISGMGNVQDCRMVVTWMTGRTRMVQWIGVLSVHWWLLRDVGLSSTVRKDPGFFHPRR